MSLASIRASVNGLLTQHWAGRTLPIDPFEVAHKQGLELRVAFDRPLRWVPSIRTLYYNPSEPVFRQRFAVAHGLGHAVLNHPGSEDPCSFDLRCLDLQEQEANVFARELLMPVGSMRLMLIDQGHTNITTLSQHFYVSEVVMRSRLVELGYLSR